MESKKNFQTNSTISTNQLCRATWKYFSILMLALSVGISCAKKQTVPDSGVLPDDSATPDSKISDQALTFDPQGSDSGKIDGLQTIHFPYDQSTLTAEARKGLQNNMNWLKKNPTYNLQIEGHCDNHGSIEYNLALGERRAKAVRTYMISLGSEPKRLAIISYGKEKPLVQGDGEEALSQNRRANFVPLAK